MEASEFRTTMERGESKYIGTVVPLNVHQALREQAALQGKTLSSFLRAALIEKFARDKRKQQRGR